MDYETKYKEALNLVMDCVPDKNGFIHVRPEDIFPELKESEDERIRRILIEAVTQVLQDQYCSNRGVAKEKVVAWLEKQGESYTKNKE